MIEPWMIALGTQALLFAVGWGDLRAKVMGNQKLSDERHEDNRSRLERIENKVDVVNGKVREHDAVLKNRPKSRR